MPPFSQPMLKEASCRVQSRLLFFCLRNWACGANLTTKKCPKMLKSISGATQNAFAMCLCNLLSQKCLGELKLLEFYIKNNLIFFTVFPFHFVFVVLAQECADIGTPPSGRFNCTQGKAVGSTCNVICNAGFLVSSPVGQTCLKNGAWSGIKPSCDICESGYSKGLLNKKK